MITHNVKSEPTVDDTMQTEQAVKMAAKLYECRDTAKQVFGDSYHERMEAYGQKVTSVANTLNCSYMAAATKLANTADDGMVAVCYLAAVVEMIEPSNNVEVTNRG